MIAAIPDEPSARGLKQVDERAPRQPGASPALQCQEAAQTRHGDGSGSDQTHKHAAIQLVCDHDVKGNTGL
ncbi:hypothetical protein I542_0483 [Mycobacteroides abscessus 1948]|uniref:Uncharacterized protein n=2 Tax=Mycobacteroides abscessus TaxID=36809 RepID=A0A829QBY3_9MYCO|nr:hypothetical protein I542_0483 [Mycobacteroides abscessus 1948]EUA70022.1 hypothetical protein I540_1766 [Mycobacteroides abscessus subsp. bolletii 1513]